MLEHPPLADAVRMACDWISDVAQRKADRLPANTINRHGFAYTSWRGAVRGEYDAAKRLWWDFCPVWHTGQAVKALVVAADALGEPRYLDAAKLGADFILRNQVWDPGRPDHGLILAFEDLPDKVNTSAVLESMHGLMLLANRLESEDMWEHLIAAGRFLLDKMYMPAEGLFRDVYDPQAHAVVLPNPFKSKDDIGGRPLVEDAVFVRLYERTGDRKFLDAHIRISETLVADQNPAGNWLDYGPCSARLGLFHPRHTYWWGMPLLDTYRATGRTEFLETAIASGRFCEKAMRADGGWIRGLNTDFNTDSFGHATSGSACAAILWLELFKQTKDDAWLAPAEKALAFCQRMQFTEPADPNLKGAILEKVIPPDGTDRSPYRIRDLGTIFFVIAAVNYLATTSAMPCPPPTQSVATP